MMGWQVAAFLAISLGLIWVSRRSLLRPRAHGFYRFFAWELIAALFVLALPRWFTDWSAWHQLISWVLLCGSIVPLWLGVTALKARGQANAAGRADTELLAFERTTQLVTDGIYKYIRHPLYSSLFLLSWGIFFKRPTWMGLGLTVGASLLLVATARCDERECIEAFGTDYRNYMRRTRMFIPYVF